MTAAVNFGCTHCKTHRPSWRTGAQPRANHTQFYCGGCGKVWFRDDRPENDKFIPMTHHQIQRLGMYTPGVNRFYCPKCYRRHEPIQQVYSGVSAISEYKFRCERCKVSWSLERRHKNAHSPRPEWGYRVDAYPPRITPRPVLKMLLRRKAWQELEK